MKLRFEGKCGHTAPEHAPGGIAENCGREPKLSAYEKGYAAGRDALFDELRAYVDGRPDLPPVVSIPGRPRPLTTLEVLDAEAHAREYHEHGSCETCLKLLHLFILERRALRDDRVLGSFNPAGYAFPPTKLET